jgi:hypothetical protein
MNTEGLYYGIGVSFKFILISKVAAFGVKFCEEVMKVKGLIGTMFFQKTPDPRSSSETKRQFTLILHSPGCISVRE